jgi:hypothetical protein
MVIRYEFEFKGRTLTVTQEISPDGSASGDNKPKGAVKDRPGIEGVADAPQIQGFDLSAKHGAPDRPQGSTPTHNPQPQVPMNAAATTPDRGGGPNPEGPGPGGGGPLAGLVIVFGPVIVPPPPGGPGGGGGGNPENPGPG